jgi:hypothetical protein
MTTPSEAAKTIHDTTEKELELADTSSDTPPVRVDANVTVTGARIDLSSGLDNDAK